ncbi:MAG: PD40 domain-containing protein, partial [Verrucomicrobiae bacterium]|nr:PD40 domain-containing protein [Verrucomicrobiae bacterium]
VVGDTNRMPDGFVFDTSDGRNHRVTAAPGDTGLVARPKELVVSRNGRFAAFVTAANGWTDGDTNRTPDVYVRDLVRGTTALASATDGTDVSLGLVSTQVQLSGDGRWAAFRATSASDAGNPGALYLRDLVSRKTTLINASWRTGTPEFPGIVRGTSHQLSVDGQTVLFLNASQWWLHVEGQTNLIPVADVTTSSAASLSPDGRRVAWLSRGSEEPGLRIREVASGEERVLLTFPQDTIRDLVFSADGAVLAYARRSDPAGLPAGNPWQVWALAIATGSEELISQTLSGSHGAGDSRAAQISADGRFIVFRSAAPGLVPSDEGGMLQVLVRDRYTQKTHRLSETAEGIPGNWHSTRPEISGDGRFAVFTSFANNLLPGDGNALEDVFLASIPQDPAPDSDNDGLPDGWERDRFGDLTRDGTGDADGDGQSDAEEWQARTDPRDARSRWEVEAAFERGAPTLRWVGHAGVNYRVERQESLTGSAWAPAGDPQPGYEGIHSLPLDDENTGGYYRVIVSQ